MIKTEQVRAAWSKYWTLVGQGNQAAAAEAFHKARHLEEMRKCRMSTQRILLAQGLL